MHKYIVLVMAMMLLSSCGIQTEEAMLFGVISDIHIGENYGALEKLVDKLAQEDIGFFIILGDMCVNEGLREDDGIDDHKEIYDSLVTVAKAGLPVYVIPGNHESKLDYYKALRDVYAGYDNVIDLSPLGSFERGGVTFVALGGYHDDRYLAEDGFLYAKDKLRALSGLVDDTKTTVFLTHGPPLAEGERGIDYVSGAGNVGDVQLNDFMEEHEIRFSISGHIHEAGQRAVDDSSEPVPEGTWSDSMFLNAGAVVDGEASIVAIKDGEMMFESVRHDDVR